MRVLRKIWEKVMFLLGSKNDVCKQAVDDGICNFGGQGRDRYGR